MSCLTFEDLNIDRDKVKIEGFLNDEKELKLDDALALVSDVLSTPKLVGPSTFFFTNVRYCDAPSNYCEDKSIPYTKLLRYFVKLGLVKNVFDLSTVVCLFDRLGDFDKAIVYRASDKDNLDDDEKFDSFDAFVEHEIDFCYAVPDVYCEEDLGFETSTVERFAMKEVLGERFESCLDFEKIGTERAKDGDFFYVSNNSFFFIGD